MKLIALSLRKIYMQE